jgi:molybdopterin biosynthesis enzyme
VTTRIRTSGQTGAKDGYAVRDATTAPDKMLRVIRESVLG